MPKKSSHSKKLTVYYVFYSLHIPLILLLVLLLLGGGIFLRFSGNSKNAQPEQKSRVVLGDDDEDDEDDDKDEDKDSDDDKDKDEDRDEDEDKEEDDDKDEDRVTNSKSGSGTGSMMKIDDDGDKKETVSRVVNPDGSLTVTKTKEEDDGKVEIKAVTYDATGNKITVEEYESEDGDQKSRVNVYDSTGNKISDYKLETEDGKKLELEMKEGESELSRVKIDYEKQKLLIKSANGDDKESEVGVRVLGNNFVVSRNGVDALTRFPITVNDETGEVLIETPAGGIALKTLPDIVVQMAKESDDLDEVSALDLESEDSGLEYKLVGTKTERLFGLFSLQIPTQLTYNAETGSLVRESEASFVTKVVQLFSF